MTKDVALLAKLYFNSRPVDLVRRNTFENIGVGTKEASVFIVAV